MLKQLLTTTALTLGAVAITVPAASAAVKPPVIPRPLTCAVAVSNQHPFDNSIVDVDVHTTAGARVTVENEYKTTHTTKVTSADHTGLAVIPFAISDATPGYRVTVKAAVSLPGYAGSCTDWFIPQARVAPPVTKSSYLSLAKRKVVYIRATSPDITPVTIDYAICDRDYRLTTHLPVVITVPVSSCKTINEYVTAQFTVPAVDGSRSSVVVSTVR
jgi:hypothetical protein